MLTVLDLIAVSPADDHLGLELLSRNPHACMDDYQKTMREIPNLHIFLTAVRNRYSYDQSIAPMIWYRIWIVLKSEEEMGLHLTIGLLRKIPDMYDRPFKLSRNPGRKVIRHCFEVLHELITSAPVQTKNCD